MRFDLRKPCKNCPFADTSTRVTFACRERAEEIEESAYRHGFPCHLSAVDTSEEDEEYGGFVFGENTQHCVGAIGMYLNAGQDSWPGTGNRDMTRKDYSEAQRLAFDDEEEFLVANERDSDRSGEASETQSGSTVGKSAGRKASPNLSPEHPKS